MQHFTGSVAARQLQPRVDATAGRPCREPGVVAAVTGPHQEDPASGGRGRAATEWHVTGSACGNEPSQGSRAPSPEGWRPGRHSAEQQNGALGCRLPPPATPALRQRSVPNQRIFCDLPGLQMRCLRGPLREIRLRKGSG